MKTSKSLTKNKFLAAFFFISLITLPLMESCKSEKKQSEPESESEPKREDPEITDNVIEIVTQNMDFQMRDTIPSGWNTFRYKNESTQTHFVLIDDYPEGKTSEDAEKVVGPVFDRAMKLISEGKTEEGYAEFANLPEWFSEVVFLGGVGLVSPGQVAETTNQLKTGAYLMECYVKMENGIFNTSMGLKKDN